MQKRIVHLTTVHRRDDTRILLKEVSTLAQADQWSLTLVVADGKGAATHESAGILVAVEDIGRLPWGRPGRAILGAWRAVREVRRLKADVVHFHDPELILTGVALKLFGHKVIYDVHEDVRRDILKKPWLPRILRQPTAWIMSLIEWLAAKAFDAIVPATAKIAERFPPHKTVVVQNFPILRELAVPDPVPYPERPSAFAYVGAIGTIRGAIDMVRAFEILTDMPEARLELAGEFSPQGLHHALRTLPGWASVHFLGRVSRDHVARILGRARAGLVLSHPDPNYANGQPIKMFEYMSAGIPVIASDFPLWREIIDGADCGLLVDSANPHAIAEGMRWILVHPTEAEAMGQRGRRAVERIYNWESESAKLVALYERLLPERPSDGPFLSN
jgi:hypothetical protein